MSILGSIMSSILGGRTQTPPPSPSAVPPMPTPTPPAQAVQRSREAKSTSPQVHRTADAKTPLAPAAAAAQVDVAAVLDKLAGQSARKLDWRSSIVDLMKLLKLDSSLAARKTLAKELAYAGDTKDTAAMNVWLHKQVMAKLAEGGGKLPADMAPKA